MSKKFGVLILIISLVSLSLSCTGIFLTMKRLERDIQYVLYLGTNDKDTNEPVFSPNEAKMNADSILVKYFNGFTIQEANGGWIEDDGVIAHEYTLMIYLSDTTLGKIYAAADELLKKFNQSSVLIQANETRTEFYSGRAKIN